MSGARKYLPITPRLPLLAHAVRIVMWPRSLMLEDVLTLRLTASSAERIRITMHAQAEAERVAAQARS